MPLRFNLGDMRSLFLKQEGLVEGLCQTNRSRRLTNRLRSSAFLMLTSMPSPYGPEGQRATKLGRPSHRAAEPRGRAQQTRAAISTLPFGFYEKLQRPFRSEARRLAKFRKPSARVGRDCLYNSNLLFLLLAMNSERMSERRRTFHRAVHFHEVAHSVGHVVGWSRIAIVDDEALSNSMALLIRRPQKNCQSSMRVWLTRYRQRLVGNCRARAALRNRALDLGNA